MEYPTPILTDIKNTTVPKLRFKETNSPIIHVNEVPKNIGDQGCLQSLVETFIGQEMHWWETNQSRLQR